MHARFLILPFWLTAATLSAQGTGPFPPAAGQPGSTAIRFDDARFVAWADTVVDFQPGPGSAIPFNDPEQAVRDRDNNVKTANNNTQSIVSLGDGGTITLGFLHPIGDGPGPDFAVFENGISSNHFDFLELAFVEVSSDGQNFVRFPSSYLGTEPLSAFETRGDPTLVDGLAGKYTVGWGTPFDLADLRGLPGSEHLDFDGVRYVRLLDIIGDGRAKDSTGRPIYDPYTEGAVFNNNGFDLNAIGVLNQSQPYLHDWKVGTEGTLSLTWRVPVTGVWSFQTSHDLIHWTESATEVSGETVTYTIEAGSESVFYRLVRP